MVNDRLNKLDVVIIRGFAFSAWIGDVFGVDDFVKGIVMFCCNFNGRVFV